MTRLARSRWLRRLGMGAIAAVSLCALTVPTAPAQARVDVGIGIPFGGYYAAPYPYPYYPYGYAYSPYYYGYPTGGVYFSFGGGHYRHW